MKLEPTLNTSASIGRHHILYDDEARSLIVDYRIIKLSIIQYRLLKLLLEGQAVSDEELIQKALFCQTDVGVQKNLRGHIDKIRNKLQAVGLCIHRVSKYGYMLRDATG